MIKRIILLKRKPGLSPEEFREQYEGVHAPLVLNLIPTIRKYVRNYITTNAVPAGAVEPEFDCITEWWFEDMESYQAMMVDASDGDAGQALGHSVQAFVDAAKLVHFLVEEVESELG